MAAMSRSQKVRLGIFVGTGITILVVAFILLAGRAMVEHRDEYKIRFADKGASFSGLEIGSDVKYSGIKIGRVDHMGVAKDKVSVIEVTISTEAGSPIAEDSKATLESAGITGMKFIDLSRGSEKARIRKPGETIPAGQSFMDDLASKATTVAAHLDELLVNIKGLTGEETQTSVRRILDSASGLLTDNRENIATIIVDAGTITRDMTLLSKRGVSVANRADTLMTQLTSAGGQVQKALGPNGDLTRAIAQSEQLIERVNMLVLRSEGDLDVTLRNLREVSANLSDFSVAVKENPSILINNPKTTDDVGR